MYSKCWISAKFHQYIGVKLVKYYGPSEIGTNELNLSREKMGRLEQEVSFFSGNSL